MINNRIAIIGSGITGLTTAYRADKQGKTVHLFDRKSEPGGVIKTENSNEWRYELGPNTLLVKDSEIENLLDELNLTSGIEEANQEASKRFIVKDGELVELPKSLTGFLKTPLFSGAAKARLLWEPFVGKTSPDVTVSEFFEKRFGKEVLNYAVNPFIAGIHAGTPEKLSLKHAFPALHQLEQQSGSVMLGGIKKMMSGKDGKKTKRRLLSFKTGLHELPKALFSALGTTHTEHELKRIEKRSDGWYLHMNHGVYGPYQDVVCTIPLHKWSSEMLPLNSTQLKRIKEVYYPPLSMLILGYKKEEIEHPLDGFGFLVPEKENRSILGALFTSTLFKNRAPDGHHLLTVFVGGGRQPELADKESSELLNIVQEELADLIGLKGEPVFKDHIYWTNSIPQYETGYDEIHSIIDLIEKKNPGLHIAGNFKGGISVPDCIKNGLSLGEKLGSS